MKLLRKYRSVQAITLDALREEIQGLGVSILANKGTPIEIYLKMRKKELEKTLTFIENDEW